MSIAEKINKLQNDILHAYNSVQAQAGTVPTNKNTENLAPAILSIKAVEDLSEELTEQNNLITNQEVTIDDIIETLETKIAGTDLSTELDEQDTLITNQNVVIEDIIETLENKLISADISTELSEQNTLLSTQEVTIDDIRIALETKSTGGTKPEGTIDITENGEYDVTTYEKANVNINTLNAYLRGTKTDITKDDMAGITQIRNHMFRQSPIRTVFIPDDLTYIGTYAFCNCTNLIGDIIIPTTVTNLGSYAFSDCSNINSLTIGNIPSIGGYVFNGCGAKELKLDGLVKVATGMFQSCSRLTAVIIPNSTTSIESYGFRYCENLESVIIGNNVTKIASAVFYSCSNLKEIICLAPTPPSLNATAFTGVPENCLIKVPADSVEAYKTATNWSDRADYIVAYEEV